MHAFKRKPRQTKAVEQKATAGHQAGHFAGKRNAAERDVERTGDENIDAAFAGKEHGEGNYKATKQYDDATRNFVRSGKVGDAAKQAAPNDSRQAQEMAEAEAKGKGRSKGEDPALYRSKPQARGR
jgi:hypothetical protein